MPSLSLKGWTLNLDLMGLKLVCVCISTLSTPWPGILVLLISWLILGLLTSWLSRMCCMASSLGGSVTKEPPHLHQEVTLLSHRSPVMWYLTPGNIVNRGIIVKEQDELIYIHTYPYRNNNIHTTIQLMTHLQ